MQQQVMNGNSEERPMHGWRRDGASIRADAERRARQLGVFSLGLGLVQWLAAGPIARLMGLRVDRRSRAALRAIAVREIASGVGLLSNPRSSRYLWARVAGDVMDLALLGDSLISKPASRARVALSSAAVLGIAAVDTLSAARLSRHEALQKLALPIHVVRAITINAAPETVYHFWRDLQNLPRFMAHLESVEVRNGTSRWRAKAPAGLTIEWEAEITLDRPNEALGWRSLEGALVPNRGVVRFRPAPGGRGTQVHVELKYDPPGGAIAAAIAKLFGEEPAQQIAGDLLRLKQLLETGSVVHSDASIHAGMHAARPPAASETIALLGEGG